MRTDIHLALAMARDLGIPLPYTGAAAEMLDSGGRAGLRAAGHRSGLRVPGTDEGPAAGGALKAGLREDGSADRREGLAMAKSEHAQAHGSAEVWSDSPRGHSAVDELPAILPG
jgi:hypothetical protein